jgi:hypothetical protein
VSVYRRSLPVGLLVGAICLAPVARAGPDEAEAARIQRALAVGDVGARANVGVEGSSDFAAAYAWLIDSWWRPVPPADPRMRAPDASTDEAARRVGWLARADREANPVNLLDRRHDPVPVLTALVLDRIRRERDGLHSTRTEGPLSSAANDESIGYFLDEWAPGAYGGPAAIADRRPEAQASARGLEDEAARNVWVAIGALLGLIVLAAVGGITLGRGPHDPTANSPAGANSNRPQTEGSSSPPARAG